MSPNVSSFVSELAEMAQATMRLPQVESELSLTQAELDRARQAIGDREQRIMQLKHEMDDLVAKLQAAEVARDHAETMFLEADERTDHYRNLVRNFVSAAGLLEPTEAPKAGPEAEAVAEPQPFPTSTTAPSEGQSEAAPTQDQPSTIITGPEPAESVSSPGQSEQVPTYPAVNTSPDQRPAPSEAAIYGGAGLTSGGGDAASPFGSATTDQPSTSAEPTASPGSGVASEANPTLPYPTGETTGFVDAEPSPRYTAEWYAWRDRQTPMRAGYARNVY